MKIQKLISNCCHFCLARRCLEQRRITRESKLLHWICSYLVRACVAAHESGVCERSLATQYFHIQSENIQGKQMFFIYCRYDTFFSRATTSYFFIYLMSGFNPFNIFSHQIGKNKHFFLMLYNILHVPRDVWGLKHVDCAGDWRAVQDGRPVDRHQQDGAVQPGHPHHLHLSHEETAPASPLK